MRHLGRTIAALAVTALTLAACADAGVDLAPSTSRAGGSGRATRIDGDSATVRKATQACDTYRKAAFGELTVIGAVAGLYPALRAARLSPTEALRSV